MNRTLALGVGALVIAMATFGWWAWPTDRGRHRGTTYDERPTLLATPSEPLDPSELPPPIQDGVHALDRRGVAAAIAARREALAACVAPSGEAAVRAPLTVELRIDATAVTRATAGEGGPDLDACLLRSFEGVLFAPGPAFEVRWPLETTGQP